MHCQGRVKVVAASAVPGFDISKLKQKTQNSLYTSAQVYQAFREIGLDYGIGHQGVRAVHIGDQQVLAQLSLPSHLASLQESGAQSKAYVLHPCMLDSALQATMGFIQDLSQPQTTPSIPFAWIN
mgnify:CR=1 FL=1